MALEKTLIVKEIRSIIESGAKKVFYKIEAEIISPKGIVKAVRTAEGSLYRSYDTEYGDWWQIGLWIPEGVFGTDILPYEDNLKVRIIRTPLLESGTSADTNLSRETQVYYANIIHDAETQNKIRKESPANMDAKGADLSNLMTVYFELRDGVIEELRMRDIGWVYLNRIPIMTVRTILGKESKKIQGGFNSVRGVDIVKPYIDTVRKVLMIPPGIPCIEMPRYVQEHCGGLYPSGIGYYLQNGMWYLYPLFDTSRFNKCYRTLTIINVPKNKYPGIERTFRDTKNQLIVISTGEHRQFDDSEKLQQLEGVGARFMDAGNIVEGYGKYVNGEYVIERVKNNHEFLATTRRNGLNYAPVHPARSSGNPVNQYTELARRNGTHMQFGWENATDSAIYPGMPVKCVFETNGDNTDVVEGVVLNVEYHYSSQLANMVQERHSCNAVITVFVNRNTV